MDLTKTKTHDRQTRPLVREHKMTTHTVNIQTYDFQVMGFKKGTRHQDRPAE